MKRTSMLVAMTALAVLASNAALSAPPAATATVRVSSEFTWTFDPGTWAGFILGPSSDSASYVVEVTPTSPPSNDGAYISSNVQREYNGNTSTWSDVVRIQLIGSATPVTANVRIYTLAPK